MHDRATPLSRPQHARQRLRVLGCLPAGARGQVSLLNIIIELKKACNHPFLFESAEDEYRCGRRTLPDIGFCRTLSDCRTDVLCRTLGQSGPGATWVPGCRRLLDWLVFVGVMCMAAC